MRRAVLLALFRAALALAQSRLSGDPEFAARLEISTGLLARVYR